MYTWIKINPGEYDAPHPESIRGVDVEVFLSPYDIPEEVSGHFDLTIKRFVIEFRYIGGDEPLVAVQEDQFVTVKVGRYSRRLYRIELDVNSLQTQAVESNPKCPEMAKNAIDRLSTLEARPRKGNYKAAKQVINDKATELFDTCSN